MTKITMWERNLSLVARSTMNKVLQIKQTVKYSKQYQIFPGFKLMSHILMEIFHPRVWHIYYPVFQIVLMVTSLHWTVVAEAVNSKAGFLRLVRCLQARYQPSTRAVGRLAWWLKVPIMLPCARSATLAFLNTFIYNWGNWGQGTLSDWLRWQAAVSLR